MPPAAETTAVLLIGFQNDYFADQGILTRVIEEPVRVTGTLKNTLNLVEHLAETAVHLVTTPIVFTPDYSELREPVGILKAIKEAGAFRQDSPGSQAIPEFARWRGRMSEIPGKRGLNAFSNTRLHEYLSGQGIRDVAVCGVVASLCIDSSARAAQELGYRVWIISDCISGRTVLEQNFYLNEVYPLYATVVTSGAFVASLRGA
jgi:nicotinamidase-related amidase